MYLQFPFFVYRLKTVSVWHVRNSSIRFAGGRLFTMNNLPQVKCKLYHSYSRWCRKACRCLREILTNRDQRSRCVNLLYKLEKEALLHAATRDDVISKVYGYASMFFFFFAIFFMGRQFLWPVCFPGLQNSFKKVSNLKGKNVLPEEQLIFLLLHCCFTSTVNI